MKNLYLINRQGSNKTTLDLFKKSAKEKSLNVYEIDPQRLDYSKKKNLDEKDLIYRICTDDNSKLAEAYLTNNKVSSLYKNYKSSIANLDNVIGYSIIHEKFNLPIIKTVFSLTNDRQLLEIYVNYLGGFPLIIKAKGGSHGIGVMKLNSFDSLLSVADFLLKKKELFILRKYIQHKKQARLIVLGDKVIASLENYSIFDFRTNVGQTEARKRSIVSYDEEINKIAIASVACLDLEFGGVDILFDEIDQRTYISEVNFPCFFGNTQALSGIDISGQIIDYLIKKSNKN